MKASDNDVVTLLTAVGIRHLKYFFVCYSCLLLKGTTKYFYIVIAKNKKVPKEFKFNQFSWHHVRDILMPVKKCSDLMLSKI